MLGTCRSMEGGCQKSSSRGLSSLCRRLWQPFDGTLRAVLRANGSTNSLQKSQTLPCQLLVSAADGDFHRTSCCLLLHWQEFLLQPAIQVQTAGRCGAFLTCMDHMTLPRFNLTQGRVSFQLFSNIMSVL